MGNKKRIVFDGDLTIHACGHSGESRTIKVVHKQSGDEYELQNRTFMYGRKKSKDGGWLAEQNKGRDTPWTVDDFDIYDVLIPAPLSHSLQSVKTMVEKTMHTLGTKNMTMFHGEGDSFRVAASTIIGYKQNRTNASQPFYKEEIIDYLKKKYKSIPCTYLEADDMLIVSAMEDDAVVASHDKDSLGCHVQVFNPTKPEKGVIDCRGFGDIWIEEKVSPTNGKTSREVKGYGRKFFWHQVNWGDPVDNYLANSATDIEWGEISSFNTLKDCTNDVECMKAVVGTYKYLYPESSKKVVGWKGDILDINWRYCLSENFMLARMLRKVDERIAAEEVFSRYDLWKD